MRRNFSALMIGLVVSLAIVSFANPDKPAVSPGAAQETSDDFLLLHDGDRVRVLFQKDAGPGSIRYRSLSNNSRLDILHPRQEQPSQELAITQSPLQTRRHFLE